MSNLPRHWAALLAAIREADAALAAAQATLAKLRHEPKPVPPQDQKVAK